MNFSKNLSFEFPNEESQVIRYKLKQFGILDATLSKKINTIEILQQKLHLYDLFHQRDNILCKFNNTTKIYSSPYRNQFLEINFELEQLEHIIEKNKMKHLSYKDYIEDLQAEADTIKPTTSPCSITIDNQFLDIFNLAQQLVDACDPILEELNSKLTLSINTSQKPEPTIEQISESPLTQTNVESKRGERLLSMLGTIFSNDIELNEKKHILEETYSIPITTKFGNELEQMDTLSKYYYNRGGNTAAIDNARKLFKNGGSYELVRNSIDILTDEELQEIYDEVMGVTV